METANLRAAGQLMRDLVEKNVYGALGGAMQKAAQLPPEERSKFMWQQASTDGNSMAQVGRNLFGRVGTLGMNYLGGNPPSINCQRDPRNTSYWLYPQDAWSQYAPLAFTARGNDKARRKKLGLSAENLLTASRVAFANPATLTPSVARADITTGVTNQMAAQAGQTPAAFSLTLQGIKLKAQVDALTDENLLTAARRQSASMNTLSNQPMSQAGLASIGITAGPLVGASHLLSQPLERPDMTGDLMAYVGNLQMSAECTGTDLNTNWTTVNNIVLGDPTFNGTLAGRNGTFPSYSAFTPRARSYQFQDVFAVGQAIRDRLVRLRTLASSLGGTTDEDVKARSGALFEVDGWAGGGRVIVEPSTATSFTVYIHDVDLAEYGLPASPLSQDLINAFAMVVAPTAAADGDLMTVAQCASGTRINKCPANVANNVWKPTNGSIDLSTSTVAATQYGLVRNRIKLTFPRGAGAGVPTTVSMAANSVVAAKLNKAVIRVKSGNFKGRVLGSTRSTSSIVTATPTANDMLNNTTSFPISPLQRKLVEQVFGFPNSNDDVNGSLADTREYCIPGVPRDIIVPLENELTSDGDSYESSWKHYLTLAKQAAQKADELGREVVEVGTRIEERKEAAADRLEQEIGGPFDKDCLDAAANGDRNFDKCSDAIKAIVNSATIDFTLLSQDPLKGVTTPAATAKATLATYLSCDTLPASVKPPVCTRLADSAVTSVVYVGKQSNGAYVPPSNAGANTIVYSALGLFPAPSVSTTSITQCAPGASDGRDPANDPEGYLAPTEPVPPPGTGTRDRWSSDDGQLRQLIQQARFVAEKDGNFRLESNGVTLADSRVFGTSPNQSASLWPGCLRPMTTTPASTPASRCGFDGTPNPNAAYNKIMNQLFRAAPCAGTSNVLGSCDANLSDPLAEMSGIRWRLMGALWTAATLSGRVPDGMFDLYIPAVDFPGAPNTQPSTKCALPITVYRPGRFTDPDPITGESVLTGTGIDQADVLALESNGKAVRVDPAYGALPLDIGDMPTWYRVLYSASTSLPPGYDTCFRTGSNYATEMTYRHVRAKNLALNSDIGVLSDWLGGAIDGAAGTAGQGVLLSGWRTMARKAKENNDPFFWRAMSILKTNFNPTSAGESGYKYRTGLSYHLRGWGYSVPLSLPWPTTSDVRTGNDYIASSGFETTPTVYIWNERAINGNVASLYTRRQQFDCVPSGRSQFGDCINSPDEGFASQQPPNQRVRYFANSQTPGNQTYAIRQFSDALGMSCALASVVTASEDLENPPPITSEADLASLERWLIAKENVANRLLARLQVENLPVQVLEAVATGTVGNGALKGQAGVAIIEAVAALRAVGASYQEMTAAVTNAKFEVAQLRGRLRTFDATQAVKNAQAAIRALENVRAAAAAVGSAVNGGGLGGVVAATSIAATTAIQAVDVTVLQPAETNELDAQRQEAMIQSSTRLFNHRKAQIDAINLVRDKTGMLQTRILQIEQLRNQVKGDLEKATGSGAWSCAKPGSTDPKETMVCRSYVNAVLNVRYSGTRIRYEQALTAARVAGYYARRSIEQRIGMRLDNLEANMGPLEAPVKWADRVCTMHGVDFDTLKKETTSTDPAEKRAWEDLRAREYANSFIGDYVDLLTQFMEQYNVSFPSQDGNDTLLLSMREDVVRNKSACLNTAQNRLRNSEQLAFAESGSSSLDGVWQKHMCTDAKCVDVSEWRVDPSVVSPPVLRGAWLRTRPAYNGTLQDEQGIAAPSGFVSQAMVLAAGDYMVSFRDASVTSAVPTSYRVSVFGEAGETLVTNVYVAQPAAVAGNIVINTATVRTIKFSVPNVGRYRLGFAPAAYPGQDGSVLIVEPQVERATATSPVAYQPTDSDGMTASKNCPSTPSELRAKFVRKCTEGAAARCFYESVDTISIDTQAQAINGSSLAEKLAAENFNYRHVDLALNLVGTGVRNCDENPTPACYGSGTIEYDLVHEANQVGIEGYDKEARRFDFGEAAVRHGKAITAERYLTLPLSSADTGLLAQTGIVKTELRGRPLDGRYKIRIYESPALRWNRLEDIQLMVRYRYWSRITGNAP